MTMTFGIAFLLMCVRWFQAGHSGTRYYWQPLLTQCIGVGGLFGYDFAYFKVIHEVSCAMQR